jgi:deoxyribodipyrimidine photolyase-related protein
MASGERGSRRRRGGGAFTRALAARNPEAADPARRRWLYIPYDQLSDRIGELSRRDPGDVGIVLVENPHKAARRPYHKQKLALILANQRHFALEQAARGVAVRYLVADESSYAGALGRIAGELGPLTVMEPAERELRAELAPLVEGGLLLQTLHEGFLTTAEQLRAAVVKGGDPDRGPWRMDAFYRRVRRDSDILMEGGKPVGGKFSFDADNRQPYRGSPPPPILPTFDIDPITAEVGQLIEERFAEHPGQLDLEHLAATAEHAEALWSWAQERCLEQFGPYQDAMCADESNLFHTRISAHLHLHRLLPARVVTDVVARDDLPLSSKEGFIRQVLGWREYVYQVHRATDGFRQLPDVPVAEGPGDAGWSSWSGRSWPEAAEVSGVDGGACPSALDAELGLPPALWGQPSGLACLDHAVADVWREGYGHHITRLMVIGNIATLLGVSPRALTDWFWVAYVDAFDWVVEPNVLGMGSFGVGEVMTTKPYVSGAPYIAKMSDYCSSCRFDPKRDCPLSNLYWAFLARNEQRLARNPRLRMPYATLRRRSAERRQRDEQVYRQVRETLARGAALEPQA